MIICLLNNEFRYKRRGTLMVEIMNARALIWGKYSMLSHKLDTNQEMFNS